MSNGIAVAAASGGVFTGSELGRTELRELLLRRGLSPGTAKTYVGLLVRAGAFATEIGTTLDELTASETARFASTLPQTRASLNAARSALRHYWTARGRASQPALDVTDLLGSPSREGAERLAAREAARRREPEPSARAPIWADMDFDRVWMLHRLRARDLAPKTARQYLTKLWHLRGWCEANGTAIDVISGPELEDYVAELPTGRSSRAEVRSALIHFFAITQRDDPPLWAVRVPRRARMQCRALEDDDARSLEAAAAARGDRKGLAVILGLYLGLRRFEIAQLRWADFEEEGWLRLVGKGNLEATIPVHPVVTEYLARLEHDDAFVFPGRFGGSANPTTIWGWVRDVAVEAGLGAVATHALRHTALATANDETGDLRSVQDFARHAEPTTTAGYTRTRRRRLVAIAEAIGGFYGRSELLADPDAVERGPDGVPLRELINLLEGPHAVDPWIELAQTIGDRPGWRLEGCEEGSCAVRFAFGTGRLSASVLTWTNERPPTFHVQCQLGPDAEDVVWWEFHDVSTLGALLGTFEGGGVPFPPTGEALGDHWSDGAAGQSEHV